MKPNCLVLFIFCLLTINIPGMCQVKKVAILPTVDRENKISYGVKLLLNGKLCEAITRTEMYEGYDRVDIASIMNEHEFQRTGYVNEGQIRMLGVMTGADYILIAEIAEFDANNYIILAKLINVETAKIERTADEKSNLNINSIENVCQGLALNLFPKRSIQYYQEDNHPGDRVFSIVEVKPYFPGGEAALLQYFNSNIRYPAKAAENGIHGRVTIQFVVTKTGEVGEVRVLRSVDPDLDKEAVRVAKTLPKFTPGMMNGHRVNVWYTVPVTFMLQGL